MCGLGCTGSCLRIKGKSSIRVCAFWGLCCAGGLGLFLVAAEGAGRSGGETGSGWGLVWWWAPLGSLAGPQ